MARKQRGHGSRNGTMPTYPACDRVRPGVIGAESQSVFDRFIIVADQAHTVAEAGPKERPGEENTLSNAAPGQFDLHAAPISVAGRTMPRRRESGRSAPPTTLSAKRSTSSILSIAELGNGERVAGGDGKMIARRVVFDETLGEWVGEVAQRISRARYQRVRVSASGASPSAGRGVSQRTAIDRRRIARSERG